MTNTTKDMAFSPVRSEDFLPTSGLHSHKGGATLFDSTRKWLNEEVNREKPALLALQKKLRSPFWDFYFYWGSQLGEEIFYILFIPFSTWLHSIRFGVQLACLLAMGIAGGNYLKNYFALPRPSAPVWRSFPIQEDHGFPSTHTISSFVLSSYTVFHLYVEQQEELLPLLLTSAICTIWFCTVSFSRLYNGFHSPIDVIGGFLFGLFSLNTFLNIRETVDELVMSKNPTVPIGLFCFGLLVLYFHPRSISGNSVLAESALVTSVATGALASRWFSCYFDLPLSVAPDLSSLHPILQFAPRLFRCLIGLCGLSILRLVGKKSYSSLTRELVKLKSRYFPSEMFKPSPCDVGDVQVQEILTKYCTYFTISFATCFLLPVLFLNLHIGLGA